MSEKYFKDSVGKLMIEVKEEEYRNQKECEGIIGTVCRQSPEGLYYFGCGKECRKCGKYYGLSEIEICNRVNTNESE